MAGETAGGVDLGNGLVVVDHALKALDELLVEIADIGPLVFVQLLRVSGELLEELVY